MRHFLYASIILLVSNSEVYSAADSIDVFPLRQGNRFTYLYTSLYTYSYYESYSISDSGIVQYTVQDSSHLDDSTIQWTILETKHLTHRTTRGHDTTFAIEESSQVAIWESTVGNHEVRGASLVWQFPSVVRFDTIPLFRYSDTADLLIASARPGCYFSPIDQYDSIYFSRDSGMYSRRWYDCEDFDDMFGTTWDVSSRLISRILVGIEDDAIPPGDFRLISNYPNPFNSSTTISYWLERYSEVHLLIFDINGTVVHEVSFNGQSPGLNQYQFNGGQLASGVYVTRIRINAKNHFFMMLLLK